MFLGKEQIHHPGYSTIEKAYIALLGMPVVGLRIRARNVFSLIPKGGQYKRILDAGSGPGVFSFELGRRFPKAKIVGMDLKKESIEACTHISDKIRVFNVEFHQASILALEEEDAYDLIICVDILEHIQDDFKALNGLYKVTAPGGTLVLHVPSLYRRYPIWKRSPNFYVETHVRIGYNLDEIQDKVKHEGFIIRESGFTYGFWETLANNLSYMITRARMENKILYSLVFPVLHLISWLGPRARPKKIGAGIFVVAEKPELQSQNMVQS